MLSRFLTSKNFRCDEITSYTVFFRTFCLPLICVYDRMTTHHSRLARSNKGARFKPALFTMTLGLLRDAMYSLKERSLFRSVFIKFKIFLIRVHTCKLQVHYLKLALLMHCIFVTFQRINIHVMKLSVEFFTKNDCFCDPYRKYRVIDSGKQYNSRYQCD